VIKQTCTLAAALALLALSPLASAEILAMMNYETKSPDSLKALRLSGPVARKEGIAIIDVDPTSTAFGEVLIDIPLPPDLVAHHIFYDRTMTKAYLTALGKSELRVIDMTSNPYRMKIVPLPDCRLGEDVIFDESNTTWYLTCMDSANVYVGDVRNDAIRSEIKLPGTRPHGLAVHTGIDRILVTDTVSKDLKEAGEVVSVLRASTHELLGTVRLSQKPPPAAEAPVEVLFVPGASPPIAYVTNMYGGGLWALTWNAATQSFDASLAFDFAQAGAGMPLEMYFNDASTRLYVTTAKPGHLHVFDLTGSASSPRLLKTLPAAEGAHHVAITRDGKLGFVQNALLNLPGLSDGSVTIVDLESEEVLGSIDTLKDAGYNPNSIVLLPEWNALAGH